MELILTVQSSGKKSDYNYRLGFDKKTSEKYFYKPLSIFLILSKKMTIEVSIACGSPPKKSYDVNKVELSDWIKTNEYNKYKYRQPTKLKFDYDKINDRIYLKFLGIK
jgi:hypothetical protein